MSDDAESTRPIDQRISDLAQEVDASNPEDMAEEDIQQIKEEWEDIYVDFWEAMIPVVELVAKSTELRAKQLQPLAELAEEYDLDDGEWTAPGLDTEPASHIDRCTFHHDEPPTIDEEDEDEW